MTAPPRRVLLTRPRDRSEALAAELQAEGIAAAIWPLIRIEHSLDAAASAVVGAGGLIFTSARGVEALAASGAPAPLHLPVYCVGPATARAAAALGFQAIRTGPGDAAALGALIAAEGAPGAGALVHVRGADAAGDLAGALTAGGVACREAIAYRAVAASAPPPEIAAALATGAFSAAAFFSPRTGTIFANHMRSEWRGAIRDMTAVAISGAASLPLAELGFRRIVVATAPTGPAMRAAICGAA